MTLSNQNLDPITGTVVWIPGGIVKNAGIGINDATAYGTEQIFTNTGDVTLHNYSYGASNSITLMGNNNSQIRIRNYGDLSLTFSSTDLTNFTNGINADGSLENYGNITLDIHKQSAPLFAAIYGAICTGDSMVNTGNVKVNVQAGISTSTNPFTLALGISFAGNSIVNSGDINVVGKGGELTGTGTVVYARCYGITANGASVLNTGRISVEATGGKHRTNSSQPFIGDDADAFGIQTMNAVTLDSRGLISVKANQSPGLTQGVLRAYQVFVNTGTTTVTGYAMSLKNQAEFTSTYDGAIKVNSGANLTFGNATLYLSIANDFSGAGEYEIPMLVEGAAAADQFTAVGPLPPEYQASLVNGNGAGLQKLKFTYAPQNDPALVGAEIMNAFDAQEHSLIRTNITHGVIKDLIPSRRVKLDAMASPDALMNGLGQLGGQRPRPLLYLDSDNLVFAGPMFLKSSKGTRDGYDAQTHGFIAGYTHRFGPAFYLGGHAGVNDIDIHFTGQGFERRYEDTLNYSLGGHALLLLDDTWLFTLMGSLFYAQTDYRDTAPGNPETASYDSHAGLVDLSVGRFWDLGWLSLVPEAGVSLSWNHREGFVTDNAVNPDVRHGSMEEIEVYGKVGLDAYARLTMGEAVEFIPHLGVGLTQTLTDGNFHTTMGVGQISSPVVHHTDRTAVTPTASMSVIHNNLEMRTGFTGAFTETSENYLFWLEIGVSF